MRRTTRGHLPLLLGAVLCCLIAGESFFIQSAAFKDSCFVALESKVFRSLLGLDLAMAVFLLMLPRLLFRAALTVQCVLTVCILCYVRIFHAPFISAIYNGLPLVVGQHIQVTSYIPWELVVIPMILCGVKLALYGSFAGNVHTHTHTHTRFSHGLCAR